MAQFLLDTHTLIWYLTDAPDLSKKVKKNIENAENQIVVSIVSFWELAVKINIGKLKLSYSLQEIIQEVEKLSIEILEIKPVHLFSLLELPLHHRDPFDRLLIAQAQSENLILLSKDENFPLYDVVVNW